MSDVINYGHACRHTLHIWTGSTQASIRRMPSSFHWQLLNLHPTNQVTILRIWKNADLPPITAVKVAFPSTDHVWGAFRKRPTPEACFSSRELHVYGQLNKTKPPLLTKHPLGTK